MTESPKAGWAREEAERLLVRWVEECAERPLSFRAWLTKEIESALLAAERQAKEECARIVEGDKAAHAGCGHEAEYWDGRTDAAIAIRATLPPTSKTE